MIRYCLFLLFITLLGCKDRRYRLVSDHWRSMQAPQTEAETARFDEVNREKRTLHGKEVKVRGKLVYEYDDAAIYPFNDCSDFKPIWLHIDQDEVDLHTFLLKNDEALVTIVGVLDTIQWFDERQYGGALKDIVHVDVTHKLTKPE